MPETVTIGSVEAKVSMADGDWYEQVTEQGPQAYVVFHCAFDQRFNLLAGLGGTSTRGDNGTIAYVKPFEYPFGTNMFAMSTGQITGFGKPKRGSDGWPTYDEARVPVTFGVPRWNFGDTADGLPEDLSGRPWTMTRVRANVEVEILPNGSFKYIDDDRYPGNPDNGRPVRESQVGRIATVNEIVMTRLMLPWVPLGLINSMAGTINKTPILIEDQVYPKGSMLFATFNTSITVDTVGGRTNEIEYVFLGHVAREGESAEGRWTALMDSTGIQHIVNTEADQSGLFLYDHSEFWKLLP